MESVGNFYGADWIGMVGNLFGLWFISKQRKLGFLIGSIGCLGWMAFGFLTQSGPSVVSNAIYIVMNIRGWRKWKEKPPQNPQ
jgi:nicotinamide riboside transporter PnuC